MQSLLQVWLSEKLLSTNSKVYRDEFLKMMSRSFQKSGVQLNSDKLRDLLVVAENSPSYLLLATYNRVTSAQSHRWLYQGIIDPTSEVKHRRVLSMHTLSSQLYILQCVKKKRPFASHPAAKRPKHSKFEVTDMWEVPAVFTARHGRRFYFLQ